MQAPRCLFDLEPIRQVQQKWGKWLETVSIAIYNEPRMLHVRVVPTITVSEKGNSTEAKHRTISNVH